MKPPADFATKGGKMRPSSHTAGRRTRVGGMDALRLRMVEDFAGLLENHARDRHFADHVMQMVADVRSALIREVQACLEQISEQSTRAALEDVLARSRSLQEAISLLNVQKQKEFSESSRLLREGMVRFHDTMDNLASSLVEKELFERQSKVLENIVLSHENVTQWESFVQKILCEFHAFFPFNFFFIAFADDQGPSIYLYCMGRYSQDIKQAARTLLSERALRQLNVPEASHLSFLEFEVDAHGGLDSLADVETITVAVPEGIPQTSGILGVAFASAHPRPPEEAPIIRSILAVMVMVVGSSRVLSRTLSELDYYSRHDALTGLFNRRYFNECLEQELSRSARHSHSFCILLIDLDDFKDINDSYGHLIGDEVLRLIADRLRQKIRKGDIPTRIGGDEFAVILPETPLRGAQKVAETIRESIREAQYEASSGDAFQITLSIGIVSYPQDAENCADLLAGADIALYQAKGFGKNSVSVLKASDKDIQHSRRTRQYAEKIRTAIRDGRVVPYFQPIVDCRTGEIFGYETLARMTIGDDTTVAAGQFIETIEKYGLGHDLDVAIIGSAFREKSRQYALGAECKRLFINLTVSEIQTKGILDYALGLCREYHIPPGDLVFEITERDAISDMAHMRRFLTLLRSRGFAFALDDFGSGYNSFHYLRELHFEFVKIDGAFIRNIITSKIDLALVRNLSHLCKELGILTVGESVESGAVYALLKEIGVDYAQGFHLGMPGPEMG